MLIDRRTESYDIEQRNKKITRNNQFHLKMNEINEPHFNFNFIGFIFIVFQWFFLLFSFFKKI